MMFFIHTEPETCRFDLGSRLNLFTKLATKRTGRRERSGLGKERRQRREGERKQEEGRGGKEAMPIANQD